MGPRAGRVAEMTRNDALEIVADEAATLVDAVSHDNNGSMVAGIWTGGNGGLLSRETIAVSDRLRLALDLLRQFPEDPGLSP